MATATKVLSTIQIETPSRPGLSAFLILSSDLAALMSAIGFSVWLTGQFQGGYELSSYGRLWPALGVFISVYGLFGMYPGVVTNAVRELQRATEATTIVYLVLAGVIFLFHISKTYSPAVFVPAWIMSLLLVPLGRSLLRHGFGQKPWWGYPVLVFGAHEPGRTLVRTLQQQPELGFKPAALLDDGIADDEHIGGVPVLHGWERVRIIAR